MAPVRCAPRRFLAYMGSLPPPFRLRSRTFSLARVLSAPSIPPIKGKAPPPRLRGRSRSGATITLIPPPYFPPFPLFLLSPFSPLFTFPPFPLANGRRGSGCGMLGAAAISLQLLGAQKVDSTPSFLIPFAPLSSSFPTLSHLPGLPPSPLPHQPISPKWLPMYRWLASLPPTTPTLAAWEVRQWVQQEWARLPLELRRTPMQRIVQYTVTAFHRIKHQGGLGIAGEGMVQGEGSVGGEEGEEDVVGDWDGRGREAGRGRDGGRRRDGGSGGDRGMGRGAERRRGAGVGAERAHYDECRSSGKRGDGEEGEEEGDEDGEGEEVGEERRGGEGDAGRRRRRGGRMATYTEHPMKKRRAMEAAVGGEAGEAQEVGRMVQQQHCALVNHFNSLVLLQYHLPLLLQGGSGGMSDDGQRKRLLLVLLQRHLLLLQGGSGERTDNQSLGQGYRGREDGDKGKMEEGGQGEEEQEGKRGEEQQSVGQGGQESKGQEEENGEGKRGGEGGDCDNKQTSAVRRHEFVPPWKPPFAPHHCSQMVGGREVGGKRQGERQEQKGTLVGAFELGMVARTPEVSQERMMGGYPRRGGVEGRGVGRKRGEGQGPEVTLEAWVVCSVDNHRRDFKGGRSGDEGSREVCGGAGRGRRGGGEMAGRGWGSLDNPRRGLGSVLCQSRGDTWRPTWASYTSHAADAPTTNISDLAVQKVLDARFHPKARPQLVIGCNEAPNELLLFDLSSGSHRPLQGHACQIQAVEYAMDGDVILSCGGSTLKARLQTPFRPQGSVTAYPFHLPLQPFRSDLVATSGASGDPRVILWDVLSAKPPIAPPLHPLTTALHHSPPFSTLHIRPSSHEWRQWGPTDHPVGRALIQAPRPSLSLLHSAAKLPAGLLARLRVRMPMDAQCCALWTLHETSHHPYAPTNPPSSAARAAGQSAPVRVHMAMDTLCCALPYIACHIIHSLPNQPTPSTAVGAAGQSAHVRVHMALEALCCALRSLHDDGSGDTISSM
ncbi:unnamed protein product [Closterium sp. Naga37s-1]|nr:unnamed protein product [Closterium sp. Naga37s-1]